MKRDATMENRPAYSSRKYINAVIKVDAGRALTKINVVFKSCSVYAQNRNHVL